MSADTGRDWFDLLVGIAGAVAAVAALIALVVALRANRHAATSATASESAAELARKAAAIHERVQREDRLAQLGMAIIAMRDPILIGNDAVIEQTWQVRRGRVMVLLRSTGLAMPACERVANDLNAGPVTEADFDAAFGEWQVATAEHHGATLVGMPP